MKQQRKSMTTSPKVTCLCRKNVDVDKKRAIDSRFDSRQKFDRKWAATEVNCFDAFSVSLLELDKHKGHHFALSAVRIICNDVSIHCRCLFLFLTWQKKNKNKQKKNKEQEQEPLFKQAQLPQSLRYYRSVTACVCLYQTNIKVSNCAFSRSYNWFRLLIQCCCLFMFLTCQKQVSYYQRIRPHAPAFCTRLITHSHQQNMFTETEFDWIKIRDSKWKERTTTTGEGCNTY